MEEKQKLKKVEMARGKWMSYKRTTIVICTINIFIALYVLHSLYTSVYMYPFSDTQRAFKYTPQQIRKMEESIQLRKQLEPVELINVVNGLKNELLMDEKVQQIPEHIKQKITDEILVTLKGVNANEDATVLQDAVESWRREKLKEATELIHEKTSNSTISLKEGYLHELWATTGLNCQKKLVSGYPFRSSIRNTMTNLRVKRNLITKS
uniref:Uncharacterized protein n=1 Tax=Solanum tuberosum TaxID=4113 RepID=M1ADT3_SOLTU